MGGREGRRGGVRRYVLIFVSLVSGSFVALYVWFHFSVSLNVRFLFVRSVSPSSLVVRSGAAIRTLRAVALCP